jgi:hypothetical protein
MTMKERDPKTITEPGFYWVKGTSGIFFCPFDLWEPAEFNPRGEWKTIGGDIPIAGPTCGPPRDFVVGDRLMPPAD